MSNRPSEVLGTYRFGKHSLTAYFQCANCDGCQEQQGPYLMALIIQWGTAGSQQSRQHETATSGGTLKKETQPAASGEQGRVVQGSLSEEWHFC